MNWINGIQSAIDYIEDNITESLDYEEIARRSLSSSFHFQRVFSILCGYTLGEYIRNRRLSLAGAELAASKERVIDVALKYGYESPDSFAKAFYKFHGITPSQARSGAVLKSFSRLQFEISLKGGSIMNYRIEHKNETVLLGYKKRFSGSPLNREHQDHEFVSSTRLNQAILQYMAHDIDTSYEILADFSDDGYDFYIATAVDPADMDFYNEALGAEILNCFESIVIPSGKYLVCETERCEFPCDIHGELYRKAVTQWLPELGCELAPGPEVNVIHWFYKKGDEKYNSSRYVELWLPIAEK